MVPGTSGVVRRERNGNRIRPALSGSGFPMSIEYEGVDEPVGKICRRYELTSGVPSLEVAL